MRNEEECASECASGFLIEGEATCFERRKLPCGVLFAPPALLSATGVVFRAHTDRVDESPPHSSFQALFLTGLFKFSTLRLFISGRHKDAATTAKHLRARRFPLSREINAALGHAPQPPAKKVR